MAATTPKPTKLDTFKATLTPAPPLESGSTQAYLIIGAVTILGASLVVFVLAKLFEQPGAKT